MKKELKPYKRYDLVADLPGLRDYELRFGPVVPLCLAYRLARRSKQRIYRLAKQGKLRIVSVLGMLMTPTKDLERFK